jgi:hypothetical protein
MMEILTIMMNIWKAILGFLSNFKIFKINMLNNNGTKNSYNDNRNNKGIINIGDKKNEK